MSAIPLQGASAAQPRAPAFVQGCADLHGVAQSQLRDPALLSGLLIAAAGAAGLSAVGAPVVRQLPDDGVAAWLPLDGCHIALRSFPERDLLLLDVIAPTAEEIRKATEVFTRRLAARDVRSATYPRG